MQPLSGLTVLVTRPEIQGKRLCGKIEENGGKALCFPTLSIVDAEDKQWLKDVVKSLDKADWAIFISPNAVLKSAPLIQHYWPLLPATLKIAAVGRGTAKALESFEMEVHAFPANQFNTEGLLALAEFQKVEGCNIVIFQGEGGRGLLGAVLYQRGAHVTHAIAYQRQLPPIGIDAQFPQWQESVDIVISTSHESLKNLLMLVKEGSEPWLLQLPLLVISPSMITLAKNLGFTQPFAAENATDEALIAALIKWKEQSHGFINPA